MKHKLYVDTKKRQMIGSDVSVLFDEESFGVKKENDPRFKANQIFMTDNKTELSKLVAQKLAKKAKEKKITKIYFDRGSYKYHGRIKVFAQTLRENGMEF